VIATIIVAWVSATGNGRHFVIGGNNGNLPAEVDRSRFNAPSYPYPVEYWLTDREQPLPVGVAAYGLSNQSGTYTPYVVQTDEVKGYFGISSLGAYNSTFSSPYGASLQLNVMLRVNTSSGGEDLWLQDVLQFDTSSLTAHLLDNIWNESSMTSSISPLFISGAGQVSNSNGTDFYVYDSPSYTYSLPLSNILTITTQTESGGVSAQFSYGTSAYDNVTISVPGIVSSTITVTPYYLTGSYLPFDAELVWGGAGGGEHTFFTQMSSQLALYYFDSAGFRRPFPAVYTFGSETGEFADNLQTGLSSTTGDSVVSVGNGSPSELTATYMPTAGGLLEAVRISFLEKYLVNGTAYVGDTIFLLNNQHLLMQYYSSYITSPGTNITLTGLQVQYLNNGSTTHLSYSSAMVNFIAGYRLYFTPTYQTYFMLTISTPLTALVNGVNRTVQSGWYAEGTTIVFSSSYYQHQSQGARLALYPSPTSIGMNGPTTVGVTQSEQYYLTVNSEHPLAATVGGEALNMNTGWYDSGTLIVVRGQTYTTSNGTRVLLANPVRLTLIQPSAVTADWMTQYYLSVRSPDPIYALVGGRNMTLASGWLNQSTSVQIQNLTDTGGHGARFVMRSLSPSLTITVLQPTAVSATYQKQFQVVLMSSPIDGGPTTSSNWYDEGASLQLAPKANVGWEFEFWSGEGASGYSGNSAAPTVILNSPINETATFYPGLTISPSGQGTVHYSFGSVQGSVTSNKTIYVPSGTTVVLNASASSLLYQFSGWSGTLSGSQGSRQLTVTVPVRVGAAFGFDFVTIGTLGALGVGILSVAVVLFRRTRRAHSENLQSLESTPIA